MKKQTSKPTSPKRVAPTAPTKPGQVDTPKPTDPLGKLRLTLSTVVFQAEASRNLAAGKDKKPTPKQDAIVDTLRYVWDAVEAATKL